MYDVIGDVHGHYAEQHQLLLNMGYVYDAEAHNFSHPEGRRAVFIGDFIDRGLENKKVVQLAMNMVESGNAHAVLGNHDYNAVHYTMPDAKNPGQYLRKHSPRHYDQHKTFLDEAERDPEFYQQAIAWFKTLPVYVKLGNDVFAHACWNEGAALRLQQAGQLTANGVLTEAGWLSGADADSPHVDDIDLFLSGLEETLPEGYAYHDRQEVMRYKARSAWWSANPATYGEAFTSLPDVCPLKPQAYDLSQQSELSKKVRQDIQDMPFGQRLFFGHIWQSGEPMPLAKNVCCVDYSVAGTGKLVAYQIQAGETELDPRNFIWVDSVNAPKPSVAGLPVLQKKIGTEFSL